MGCDMNRVVYRRTLDLAVPGIHHTIYARRGDSRSRVIMISLKSGGTSYVIAEGVRAFMYALSDGAKMFIECNIIGNCIEVPITTNMLNANETILEVKLTVDGTEILTTPKIAVASEEALYPDGSIEATDDFSALLQAILAAENSKITSITSDVNVITITYNGGDTVSFEIQTIKGDKGDPGYTPQKNVDYFDGEDGVTWHYGTGLRGKGENIIYPLLEAKAGDYYLNIETGDMYVALMSSVKSAEVWKYIGNLKGDKGDPGYTPVKNVDYFDGKSGVHIGSSQPTDDSNVWINPDGEPTSVEEWEFDLDDNTTETKTVVVLDSDDATEGERAAILRVRQADGTFIEIPALKGNDGKDGVHIGSDTPPDDVNVWINPDGLPTSVEEWEFDLADGTNDTKTVVVMDSDNASEGDKAAILRVRQKDGTFVEIPALIGPKGDKGDSVKGDKGDPGYTPQKNVDYFDGEDGVTWHYGTGLRGKGENILYPLLEAKAGDYYLNTETGGVYVALTSSAKSAEVWKYIGNLKGVKGDPGYTPVKNVDYFDGKSGVHIGSSQPTDDSNVWINPDGEPTSVEEWEFDLDDGTSDTKNVVVLDSDEVSSGSKAAIMQLKDANGDWIEIPAIKGKDGYTPQKNVDYFDGKNGTSVTVASVSESAEDGGSNVITFSDSKTVTIKNGKTGAKGDKGDSIKGDKGDDGVSPTIAIEEETNGYHITLTDTHGSQGFSLKHGKDGSNGQDAVSPTISTEAVDGGHRIVLTDKNGSQGITVKDGAKGDKGDSISITHVTENMGSGATNHVKFSDGSTLYVKNGVDGAKGDSYVLTDADKTNIASQVKALFATETWTFTLEDGSTVTKAVYVG